jgi:diguanylate cyclase (GGDEF)-like protein/PAS domain S-box-containing protein
MQILNEPELRYRRLFDTARDGILMLDARTGVIEDVNPYLVEMLGYPREEFLDKKLWETGPFKEIEASQDAFEALAQNEYTRYEELRIKAKNGRLFQVEFHSNVYPVDNEKVIQCNIRDITERKHAQDALLKSTTSLRERSVRDHRTGLFNRIYMEETLKRELLRASRTQLPLGIIMLDVDGFKQFNAIWSQATGDVVLDGVGNLLLRHFRGDDVACRYGGDEFVIVMPGASRIVTWERAKFISDCSKKLYPKFEGQILNPVTLSLGVACFPEHASTSAALLLAASTALDNAKRAGTGRVVVAQTRQESA